MSYKKPLVLTVNCNIDVGRLSSLNIYLNIKAISKLGSATSADHKNTKILVWNNQLELTPDIVAKFPDLKYIINWGTSSWNIHDSIKKSSKYKIGYIEDYATKTVAQFGVDKLLKFINKINLKDKKVGIIGLGQIGFSIVKILQAEGVDKFFYSARQDKKLPNLKFANIETILNNCDYVFVATKSSKEINLAHINNPKLTIVNLCRNAIFNTEQLKVALEQGHIHALLSDTPKVIESNNAFFYGHVAYKSKQSYVNKHNKLVYLLKRICMAESLETRHIYFIRHGETEWNRDRIYQGRLDSPLTNEGIKQVRKVAAFLLGRNVRRIFTSPLGRAQKSARIIGEILNIDPEIQGFLREQHFGDMQGMRKSEAKEQFAGFFTARKASDYAKLYHPYPGEDGESYFDLYDRINEPFLQLLAETDGNLGFVGHESINRMLRGFARDLKPHEMVDYRQDNDQVVALDFAEGTEEIITVK